MSAKCLPEVTTSIAKSIIRYIQYLAAGLAVHGVGIVPQQCALRTSEAHLVGDQNRAREPEKQRHPEYHDDDGDQPAQRARQRYVAEPGGGQRGDGEIERV